MAYVTEVLKGSHRDKAEANAARKLAKSQHPSLVCFRFGPKAGPFQVATLDMSKLDKAEQAEALLHGAVVTAQALLRPKPAASPESEAKREAKAKAYLSHLTPIERKAFVESIK
jgi:hypothetical protein